MYEIMTMSIKESFLPNIFKKLFFFKFMTNLTSKINLKRKVFIAIIRGTLSLSIIDLKFNIY